MTGADTFAEIYDSHYDPMIRLAYLTTNSMAAAEDIVQDAFVELYRHLPEVMDPPRLALPRGRQPLRVLAAQDHRGATLPARCRAARGLPAT